MAHHHLSRQFLFTASSFPYSSKNSSAEHTHTLPTCLTFIITHTQRKHTHIHTHTHTKHTHWRIHTHAHTDMYKKAWICSAEEFLELYEKVEAVVRYCLLRWSGHLFEVPSTHFFDQCFCFKHISLLMLRQEHFSAGTLLFFTTPKILLAEVG